MHLTKQRNFTFRRNGKSKALIILGILATIAFIGIYFATKQPAGKWICKTGTWIAEGKPTSPKPEGVCKEK